LFIADVFSKQLSNLNLKGEFTNQLLERVGSIETIHTVATDDAILQLNVLRITWLLEGVLSAGTVDAHE
jgi:hypothetical protein